MLEKLAREANDFETRRHCLSAESPDRLRLWPQLRGLGAFGLAFTEDQGGFGGTALDLAVLFDALAPSLPVEPIVPALVTAGRLLGRSGGGLTTDLLNGMIDGARVLVLAHTEGFDPFARPRLSHAVPSQAGYVLDGMKPAVRGADVATDIVVSALLPGGEIGLFVLDPATTGLTLERTRLIDAAGAADLAMREVFVAAESRLPVVDPMAAITDAFEWSLMALAVETASLIREANRATFDYLNVREQFGQKLARFQALQHKVADMAIAQAEAEAVAMRAIELMDLPPSRERSRALLLASLASDAAGRFVGHTAIQLHGGMGVSDELIVSHFGRRFAAIRVQIASADARQARILDLREDGS
jgi:alkylation response protein AidB-like acyl-CoA dehydrogenase